MEIVRGNAVPLSDQDNVVLGDSTSMMGYKASEVHGASTQGSYMQAGSGPIKGQWEAIYECQAGPLYGQTYF